MALGNETKVTREEADRQRELAAISRQRRITERNEGRDPNERAISEAEGLLSSRGYTAAKFGEDRAKVREIINRAAQAEPLTAQGRRRVGECS